MCGRCLDFFDLSHSRSSFTALRLETLSCFRQARLRPVDIGWYTGTMNELERIVREAATLGDEPALLATVVRVSGSSYRRAGARACSSPDRDGCRVV